MRVTHPTNESVEQLWSLVYAQTQIDPTRLADAIEQVMRTTPAEALDQRTRKLVVDTFDALEEFRDSSKFDRLTAETKRAVKHLQVDPLSFSGRAFHRLGKRLMPETNRETIEKAFRLLDESLRHELRIYVAGSSSLIVQEYMRRNTEDIDIVDEVPAEFRNNHKLLSTIADRFELQISHVQSHYLPNGWQVRANSFGDFSNLHVYMVDPLDIFVGKLFSKRLKDQQHLDVLVKQFDRDAIRARLLESASDLMADEFSRPNAEKNWYVLFGEKLPTIASDKI